MGIGRYIILLNPLSTVKDRRIKIVLFKFHVIGNKDKSEKKKEDEAVKEE